LAGVTGRVRARASNNSPEEASTTVALTRPPSSPTSSRERAAACTAAGAGPPSAAAPPPAVGCHGSRTDCAGTGVGAWGEEVAFGEGFAVGAPWETASVKPATLITRARKAVSTLVTERLDTRCDIPRSWR